MAGTQELAKELERYKKAYFSLDLAIRKHLGPAIGLPRGPFPEICADCQGGPCNTVDACSQETLTACYCPEELVELAAMLLMQRSVDSPPVK